MSAEGRSWLGRAWDAIRGGLHDGDGTRARGDETTVRGSGAVAREGGKAATTGAMVADTINQTVNNYVAGAGRTTDRAELERQVTDYVSWLAEDCRWIELRGVQRGGRQVMQLPLDDAYVALEAEVASEPDAERRMPGDGRDPAARTVELSEVLPLGSRLVITGGPGSGKTTVLLHVARTLALAIHQQRPERARELLGIEGEIPLPILVPLSRIVALRRSATHGGAAVTRTFAAAIAAYLVERQASFRLPEDFLESLLLDGRRVVLLLDGLDEVADEAERVGLRADVEDLVKGRNGLRVIVTCRSVAHAGRVVFGHGFREVRVKPLDEAHVESLVRRAYRCVHEGDESLATQKADELLEQVRGLEAEHRARQGDGGEAFVSSPLMVRMLLVVHLSQRRLPDQRAELYERATDAMLLPEHAPDARVGEEIGRLVGSKEEHLDLVQHLAFAMHSRGPMAGREITEADLRAVLSADPRHARLVDDFVRVTRLRGTLLEERGSTYRFIHLAFQEFLAARYLVEVKRDVDRIVAFVEDGRLTESWWREPALLVAGYLVVRSSPRVVEDLLRRLAGIDARASGRPALAPDAQLAAVEIAATALLEWSSAGAELRSDIIGRLLALVEDRVPMGAAAPPFRARAADALARLGDPRPAVMTVDGMELCLVPAGPFWSGYGADVRLDPTLDRDFWMGRYAVTNAQFREFVEAGGYANEALWPEAKAIREWNDGRVKDYSGQRRAAPHDFGTPYNLANHPVVGVNWYEALAFARWLQVRWNSAGFLAGGYHVMLPSEREWEKAARGGVTVPAEPRMLRAVNLAIVSLPTKRNPTARGAFPWGATADMSRANYVDTGIGTTTAVGCFPSGASRCGCEDMSGNVWEWTRPRHEHEPRVSRGGGYQEAGDFLHCTAGLGYTAGAQVRDLGFRVVVSPSSDS